jgi:hypothetical protein
MKIKIPKAPKRNPLVVAVIKKAVKKHKNKKREVKIKGEKYEQN